MANKQVKKGPAKKTGSIAKQTMIKQTGSKNVASAGDLNISGDLTFGNKTVTTTTHINIGQLDKAFGEVTRRIDDLRVTPDVRAELKENVEKIRQEVKKGEQADPAKVERWLKFIGAMSNDIVQVVGATLVNPAAGVGTAIRLIAKKAAEGK